MPTVTADRVVNQNLYAKTSVKGYGADLKTVKANWMPGQLIGTVYSWINGNDGNLYWLVYTNPGDYASFNPTFIKHDAAQLSLPALPGILEQIKREREQKEIAEKGVVSYYIEKYMPWIIGAGVVAIALPAITKQSKVGAMTNDDKRTAGLIGAGILLFILTRKKRTGTVIVDPLDKGEFVPDTDVVNNGGSLEVLPTNENTGVLTPVDAAPQPETPVQYIPPVEGGGGSGSGTVYLPGGYSGKDFGDLVQPIDYVGPFAVSYINGRSVGRRIDLKNIKVH